MSLANAGVVTLRGKLSTTTSRFIQTEESFYSESFFTNCSPFDCVPPVFSERWRQSFELFILSRSHRSLMQIKVWIPLYKIKLLSDLFTLLSRCILQTPLAWKTHKTVQVLQRDLKIRNIKKKLLKKEF